MTYVAPSGRNDIQKALDSYDDFDREHFSRAVAHLANELPNGWNAPHAKKLSGVKDLYEIRYKASNKATRALGFFGPGPDQFTITGLATHKQDVWTPHDAIQSARRRADEVKSGEAGAAPLQIDGEDFPPDGE